MTGWEFNLWRDRLMAGRPMVGVWAAIALCTGLCGAAGPALAQEIAPPAQPPEEARSEAPFAALPVPQFAPDIFPAPADLGPIEPPHEAGRPLGRGIASYYGRRFHGRQTASGQRFDMHAMTAAHRTLPFGSRVRVTNPRNGRSVVVHINDRGPYIGGRTIDLSRAAAEELGMIQAGVGPVVLELLDS